MQISFASLFTAEAVGASFDSAIESQAIAGRVPAMLTDAVQTHYGVTIPASPKAAMIAVNTMAAMASPLSIVKGAGARSSAATLMQALYRMGELLGQSPAKGLPALSPLPAWADPVAIQAAKDKRKAAKAAKSVQPDPETEEGEGETPEPGPVGVAPDMAQQIATAMALIQAAAKAGQLTQTQWDAIRALAESSAPVAAPAKATTEEQASMLTSQALESAKTSKAPKKAKTPAKTAETA